MESNSESKGVLLKSVIAVAVVSSIAAAAVLVWMRRPGPRSRRLIDRCDEALSELEHRSPSYALPDFQRSA